MSKFEKNDVVTVITTVGEFVGKITDIDDENVVLKDPRAVIVTPDGYGFASSISMTAEPNIKECILNMASVITIVKTNESVAKQWHRATSGLVVV